MLFGWMLVTLLAAVPSLSYRPLNVGLVLAGQGTATEREIRRLSLGPLLAAVRPGDRVFVVTSGPTLFTRLRTPVGTRLRFEQLPNADLATAVARTANALGQARPGSPPVLVVIGGGESPPLDIEAVRGLPRGSRLHLIGVQADQVLTGFGGRDPWNLNIHRTATNLAAASMVTEEMLRRAHPLCPSPMTMVILGTSLMVALGYSLHRIRLRSSRLSVLIENAGDYDAVSLRDGGRLEIAGYEIQRVEDRIHARRLDDSSNQTLCRGAELDLSTEADKSAQRIHVV